MKKYLIALVAVVFLTGCGVKTMIYSSDSLGLDFEYPSKSYGENVSLQEDLSEDGETGVVSLMTDESVIASLSVEMIDSPTGGEGMINHLWTILLNKSEACSIEEISITEEKEVYGFNSQVFPFGDDFDENCRLNTNIYYFPEQVNKVVGVGTGQAPAFEQAINEDFLNSINLAS
ncbi:membrane lipoprotein lipid attachment site-containing protein [Candidatus Peregrinibacteria bacterium]|nr:membrane lipoprotein lipid attachment site-containing protein [Candidatus Peregrinibacteria bacterium]